MTDAMARGSGELRRHWTWAGATVQGTSHHKAQEPKQDSAVAAELASQDGSVIALVVCDGAGSASKGDVGSRTACIAALSVVRAYLGSGRRVSHLDSCQAEQWLSEMRGRIAKQSKRLNVPIRELATTVTIALASRSHTFIIAVGDSPCVIQDGAQWLAPIWPMRGEYANQTFFITQDPIPSWDCVLIEAKIDRLAVFSDGIDKLVLRERNKEVFAPFFDGVFENIGGLDAVGRNRAFSNELSSFLASSRVNDLTDDDKTLVVAARSVRQ